MARKATRQHTATRRTVKKTAKKRTAGTSTARKKTGARAAASRRRRTSRPTKSPSRVAAATALVKGAVAGAVSAIADRLPWSASDADALEMLERDHRRFEDLLAQGEATTERARKTRRELLDTLTSELEVHELKEEKVLYPALQSHPEARDIVLEGFEEHHIADLVVKELHEVASNDEAWRAKFKVLGENLEHHIQEEEREMFRIARGLLTRDELRELASRMRALDPSSRRRGRARRS